MNPESEKMPYRENSRTTVVRFSRRDIRTAPDAVARYFGGSRFKPDRRHLDRITMAIEQAAGLIRPACAYTLHPVKSTGPDGLLSLENGVSLTLPAGLGVSRPRYLAACVCTLGKDLDASGKNLAGRNDIYQSLLLDAVGVSLMDALADLAHGLIRERAQDMGLFTGCRFGPGTGGMPLNDQALLFRLVDVRSIAVTLTDSLMMNPVKSLSFFVTLGSVPTDPGDADKCSRCGLKSCAFRVVARRPPK